MPGSIVFPAKLWTHPAEFGKIAGNRRHLCINTDTVTARSGRLSRYHQLGRAIAASHFPPHGRGHGLEAASRPLFQPGRGPGAIAGLARGTGRCGAIGGDRRSLPRFPCRAFGPPVPPPVPCPYLARLARRRTGCDLARCISAGLRGGPAPLSPTRAVIQCPRAPLIRQQTAS
jgi:hypothetical protein